MGTQISLSDYSKIAHYLTRPASLISIDRYTRVWERDLLGSPVQFIHRYTDPNRLLVVVGEAILKSFLGL
uniref:Uncharacterized protein n=1 Tax=viral metagenome TaxID=1070528 RepID=A0A6M3LZJ3_9ZZZZ